jgi:hypothetical protein
VSLQSDIIAALTGNAGLHNLVADRIWPGKWPQNPQLPYIVLFEIGSKPSQSMSCAVVIRRRTLRFIISAETYSSTVAIGAALETALLAMGEAIIFEDERSDVNMTSGVHRRDIDVRISHAA